MSRSRPITFLLSAAVLPLTALAISACGGGGAATASPPPAAPKAPKTQPTTIRVANSKLGQILVNAPGRTLYLFKADVGTKSVCSGACAVAWPPLLATGNPVAGTGVTASKLGTTTRSGGTRQVTYNGHPLYLFIKDKKAGDVTGQGVVAFGAAWFVLSPAGNQIGGGSSSTQPAAPAAPKPPSQPAPAPAPAQPAPKPTPPPAPKPAPPASGGIPQNNGGDGDSDNNGGPSDGDGNV